MPLLYIIIVFVIESYAVIIPKMFADVAHIFYQIN